jgi:hypothetical protein
MLACHRKLCAKFLMRNYANPRPVPVELEILNKRHAHILEILGDCCANINWFPMADYEQSGFGRLPVANLCRFRMILFKVVMVYIFYLSLGIGNVNTFVNLLSFPFLHLSLSPKSQHKGLIIQCTKALTIFYESILALAVHKR